MIQRVLIVGFVMFGVVAIGQTPLFRFDSLPNVVLLKHAPNLTSFDSLKKLPSQLLKRYDMSGDIMVDEMQVSSQETDNAMPIYSGKSRDTMNVVTSGMMTKQYLQIYGVEKVTLNK